MAQGVCQKWLTAHGSTARFPVKWHADMSIDEAALGPAIRDIRSRFGLTQRDLSERTGLTINYISLLENGHRGISIPNLNIIAEVLGVPAVLLTALATRSAPGSGKEAARLLSQIQSLTRQAIALYAAGGPLSCTGAKHRGARCASTGVTHGREGLA